MNGDRPVVPDSRKQSVTIGMDLLRELQRTKDQDLHWPPSPSPSNRSRNSYIAIIPVVVLIVRMMRVLTVIASMNYYGISSNL
jgi:hypothetical protein